MTIRPWRAIGFWFFLVLVPAFGLPVGVAAQGEGAHTYFPAPKGTNILVPTYMHMSSNFNFAGDILIQDADIQSDIGVVSYLRLFAIGGRLSELWVTPIFGSVDGDVVLSNQTVHVPRESGFADPYVAVRVGLVGAPALNPAEFMKHAQTFQLYALAGAYIPIGEYDSSEPLNLGTNRWAIRFGVPMVIPFDAALKTALEVVPTIVFYTDNTDPYGASEVREQDPVFIVESHLSHTLTPKFWGALDLRYQNGGETTTDGVSDDNRLSQLGGGATIGYQVTRALGFQSGYGGIFAKNDGSKGTMLRLRMTYAF
jgi:hypothetical protein